MQSLSTVLWSCLLKICCYTFCWALCFKLPFSLDTCISITLVALCVFSCLLWSGQSLSFQVKFPFCLPGRPSGVEPALLVMVINDHAKPACLNSYFFWHKWEGWGVHPGSQQQLFTLLHCLPPHTPKTSFYFLEQYQSACLKWCGSAAGKGLSCVGCSWLWLARKEEVLSRGRRIPPLPFCSWGLFSVWLPPFPVRWRWGSESCAAGSDFSISRFGKSVRLGCTLVFLTLWIIFVRNGNEPLEEINLIYFPEVYLLTLS